MTSRNTSIVLAGLVLLASAAAAAAGSEICQAQSPDSQVRLIELFTSEGCSSCPPADRWLSTLKGQPQVLAAAFHVDYWDRLGWHDRFSDAAYTARQKAWVRREAGRFAYTPQVLVNGRDWRGWPTLPLQAAPARVRIELQRGVAQGVQGVQAQVTPLAGAPAQLALWWALLEDGHRSLVRAGENSGEQLHHDHVVRQYGELPAWSAVAGAARRWTLKAVTPGAEKAESGHKARFLVVVTDALSGVPLQAAQLDCLAAG